MVINNFLDRHLPLNDWCSCAHWGFYWSSKTIFKIITTIFPSYSRVWENMVSNYFFHIHLPSLSYLFYHVGLNMGYEHVLFAAVCNRNVSCNGLQVWCLHGGEGHCEGWEWHQTPLEHHDTSALPKILYLGNQTEIPCVCHMHIMPAQRGQQLPCCVAMLLCWWNGVCGSVGFPMVLPRGFWRGEITLQNPALLKFCFFDLSHSFLNMQQCKYIYSIYIYIYS